MDPEVIDHITKALEDQVEAWHPYEDYCRKAAAIALEAVIESQRRHAPRVRVELRTSRGGGAYVGVLENRAAHGVTVREDSGRRCIYPWSSISRLDLTPHIEEPF